MIVAMEVTLWQVVLCLCPSFQTRFHSHGFLLFNPIFGIILLYDPILSPFNLLPHLVLYSPHIYNYSPLLYCSLTNISFLLRPFCPTVNPVPIQSDLTFSAIASALLSLASIFLCIVAIVAVPARVLIKLPNNQMTTEPTDLPDSVYPGRHASN